MVEGATVEAAASGGLWAALPGGGFGWLASAHLGDYAPLEEAGRCSEMQRDVARCSEV